MSEALAGFLDTDAELFQLRHLGDMPDDLTAGEISLRRISSYEAANIWRRAVRQSARKNEGHGRPAPHRGAPTAAADNWAGYNVVARRMLRGAVVLRSFNDRNARMFAAAWLPAVSSDNDSAKATAWAGIHLVAYAMANEYFPSTVRCLTPPPTDREARLAGLDCRGDFLKMRAVNPLDLHFSEGAHEK